MCGHKNTIYEMRGWVTCDNVATCSRHNVTVSRILVTRHTLSLGQTSTFVTKEK